MRCITNLCWCICGAWSLIKGFITTIHLIYQILVIAMVVTTLYLLTSYLLLLPTIDGIWIKYATDGIKSLRATSG